MHRGQLVNGKFPIWFGVSPTDFYFKIIIYRYSLIRSATRKFALLQVKLQHDLWLEKADNETQTEVSNLIDKYGTLFINYNFLYNMVPAVKAKQTNTPRKAVGDRAGATTCMIEFIGAPVISQYLSSEELDPQVDRLFAAMPHFNIDLDKGTPQPLKMPN